jgi:uncharacterized membrane protein YraQ (UPF0718 family)
MIKKLLKHKILLIAIIGYVCVFAINSEVGIRALKESKYYFIEMIQILPPIFILTSLIQTWVPTKVIMDNFGNGSGIRGKVISFAIGSLSAGPIYAAFPVCKTLVKKGASIDNIVIILSSWAVIKLPMLINEAKFMGINYMIVRWVLTLIAIIIMAKIMKLWTGNDKISAKEEEYTGEIIIDKNICVLCGSCVRKYPDIYIKKNKEIIIEKDSLKTFDNDEIEELKSCCPFGAIK